MSRCVSSIIVWELNEEIKHLRTTIKALRKRNVVLEQNGEAMLDEMEKRYEDKIDVLIYENERRVRRLYKQIKYLEAKVEEQKLN